MFNLLLLYGAGLGSGWVIQRHLYLNSLLQRGLILFIVGSAQLCSSVQMLSLFDKLEPASLLILNGSITIAILLTVRRFVPAVPDRLSSSDLAAMLLKNVRANLLPFSTVTLMVTVAGMAMIAYFIFALLLFPMNDSYHFEMPAYWIQNKSIRPFPINNPRIIGIAFFAESLCLPGYLYTKSALIFPVLSFLIALPYLGIVVSLAARLGCNFRSSMGAGALCVGCFPLFLALTRTSFEVLVAGVFAGASALWLLESMKFDAQGNIRRLPIILSVISFCLACGAKNTMLLVTPVFLLALLGLHGCKILSVRWIGLLAGAGLMALLASGVPWNLFNNYKWFGSPAGSSQLQGTISREFQLRPMWTRVVRGSVLVAYDCLWIPRSYKSRYSALCANTAAILGALPVLDEDDDYYSFDRSFLKPQKGIGFFGPTFWIPAVIVGLVSCRRTIRNASTRAVRTLIFLSIGSFVICHLLLRWQSISNLRLIPCFLIFSAPLFALLLHNKWWRGLGLGILSFSVAVVSVFSIGLAARRVNLGSGFIPGKIRVMQNSHFINVSYTWKGQAPRDFQMQEDYTKRELYDLFLQRIPSPVTFGYLAGYNSESYFLFGKKFENRIISLVDCRKPTQILPVLSGIEYFVCDDFDFSIEEWSQTNRLTKIFEATDKQTQRQLLTVYKKGSN